MTPDNPHPRKRRRRRRRAGAAGGATPLEGNGNQPNGNVAYSNDSQYPGQGPGGGGRRRRRSRRRNRSGGGGGGMMAGPDLPPAPIDVAPGELVPSSGVLWIKPNGTGILVQPANNYVPVAGDSVVPRSVIERLHLQAGLHLS